MVQDLRKNYCCVACRLSAPMNSSEPLGHGGRQRRIVLRAIAVIGDPLYLPWLIWQFDDLTIAQRAGMAVATITGIDLDDLGWDLPLDFNAGPNRDPDDEG